MVARRTGDPDPLEKGVQRFWISNALSWSVTARRLLQKPNPQDVHLGFVAAFLSLELIVRILRGARTVRGIVRADVVAAADCPMPRKDVQQLSRRLRYFRNAILHHADFENSAEGRSIITRFTRGEVALDVNEGVPDLNVEGITASEVGSVFDQLHPWLTRHWERVLAEVESAL